MSEDIKKGVNYLSQKKISPEERLIFALDVPTERDARTLVERLGDAVSFYKIGLELFMSGAYFSLIDWLVREKRKKVFADLKFFDVPETVRSAIKQLHNKGITFTTVHGNDSILEAAVKEKGDLKILSVTVLTSLDQKDIEDLGFKVDIKRLVLSRAKRSLEIGCDGVISSGLEASELRKSLGDNFLIISPGIRPILNRSMDDQKRTVDVEEAFLNGADYIVVGRPIRIAPDPRLAAENIQQRIRRLFT
ncbi:MAG: orotidine-5'-phosphate decarboxylase [Thermodesulfovibrionales bacterium]|nr:orotidine-5'-phosphate decarboxylase [Thermodesulfovibrionales bacterium]